MFIQRITRTATPGKGRDLRALLEERTRSLQSDGLAAGFAAEMYGENGETFVSSLTVDDMATLETQRQRILSDSRYQQTALKIAALQHGPASIDLYDIFLPNPNQKPARFIQRVTFQPSVGRGRDVRALLEEQIRRRQASGIGAMLGERVFGRDNAAYQLWISFEHLAEVQALRDLNRTDEAFAAFQAKLSSLLASEPRISLVEMIITPALAQAEPALAGAARR